MQWVRHWVDRTQVPSRSRRKKVRLRKNRPCRSRCGRFIQPTSVAVARNNSPAGLSASEAMIRRVDPPRKPGESCMRNWATVDGETTNGVAHGGGNCHERKCRPESRRFHPAFQLHGVRFRFATPRNVFATQLGSWKTQTKAAFYRAVIHSISEQLAASAAYRSGTVVFCWSV